MWDTVRDSRKSARLAVAGSIYMRKKSLQAALPPNTCRESNTKASMISNPSSGKIVKNRRNSVTIADKVNKFSSEICQEFDAALSSTLKIPLTDKKNIIPTEVRKNSPAFAHFDEQENEKIKKIEEKYRNMLENYEKKKKAISSQLQHLQSGEDKNGSNRKKSSQKKEKKEKKVVVHQYNENDNSFGKKNLMKEADQKEKKVKQKLVHRFQTFFTKLKGQIKLEEDIRKIKYKLQNKEKEVEEILSQSGKTAEEIKKMLQLDLEETDPFFVPDSEHCSTQQLAKMLLRSIDKAEGNWKENVEGTMKKTDAKVLFNELNFEKKDEISLRSFVREVGFHLEKHYRNRDLLRIYEKMKPCNEQAFLQAFCGQSD